MSPSLATLKLLLTATSAFAVGLLVHALAAAPRPPASYLGIRGAQRRRAARTSALFARIEPVLRWLGRLIDPLFSASLRRRIDRQLTLSGDFWGLSPGECCALTLLSGAAGLASGLALGAVFQRTLLYAMTFGLIGAVLPYLQLSTLEQARMKEIRNGLPHVIDLLTLAVSAGLDFPGALRQIVDKSSAKEGALTLELALILQELEVGKTRSQALSQFAERAPGDSVREFVSAVIQAEARGNPLAHVIEIQADASRQRRSTRAEEAASHAGVKMLVPMVLVFGAILLLIVAPMILQLRGTFRSG